MQMACQGYNCARTWSSIGLPYGLVVRIPAFHAGGPGSIPGVGTHIFSDSIMRQVWKSIPSMAARTTATGQESPPLAALPDHGNTLSLAHQGIYLGSLYLNTIWDRKLNYIRDICILSWQK